MSCAVFSEYGLYSVLESSCHVDAPWYDSTRGTPADEWVGGNRGGRLATAGPCGCERGGVRWAWRVFLRAERERADRLGHAVHRHLPYKEGGWSPAERA